MDNLLRICLLMGIAASLLGETARASNDDLDELPRAAQPNEDGFEVSEENFDQWIYRGASNAEAGKERLRVRLKIHLDELDRICKLTPAQMQKLTLAGRGDMKRFFDQVETLRIKFRAGRKNQNAFNELWAEINPLAQKVSSDLFADKSFFAKTLRNTLTAEQYTDYQVVAVERRQFRYRAAIAVAFTNLEKTVPLRHSQRQVLMELLLQETRPPRTFGSHDYHLVIMQLSRQPEEKLKAVLDDRQWKLLEGHFAMYRGMEQMLFQQGVIDKEDLGPVKRVDDAPADATRPERPRPPDPAKPNRQRIDEAIDKLNAAPSS